MEILSSLMYNPLDKVKRVSQSIINQPERPTLLSLHLPIAAIVCRVVSFKAEKDKEGVGERERERQREGKHGGSNLWYG